VRSERGSATVVVAAVLGVGALLTALSGDLSRFALVRSRAQTAADAAALAAAQELVFPSAAGPSEVAQEYAHMHGASLTDCLCDTTSDEVVVEVGIPVTLPFLGRETIVTARARAVVDPSELAGLSPMFAERLRCLFAKVEGLSVVSGFRTYDEQAALFEEKPDLAAPPGHSMHEVGLAADLAYASERVRAEAHTVAPSCGLEFPVPNEPWHVEPSD
jgi:secretion/DNA translocation related TadE-like protein